MRAIYGSSVCNINQVTCHCRFKTYSKLRYESSYLRTFSCSNFWELKSSLKTDSLFVVDIFQFFHLRLRLVKPYCLVWYSFSCHNDYSASGELLYFPNFAFEFSNFENSPLLHKTRPKIQTVKTYKRIFVTNFGKSFSKVTLKSKVKEDQC